MGFFQVLVKTLTGKTLAEPVVESILEPASTWDPSTSWYGSEEEELEERAKEKVWDTLEDVHVNTGKRQVLFSSTLQLTLPQTMAHLQKMHSELPAEIIEGAMLEWLEENTAPDNATQKQMDAHDQAIESWIDEYWRKQENTLENS